MPKISFVSSRRRARYLCGANNDHPDKAADTIKALCIYFEDEKKRREFAKAEALKIVEEYGDRPDLLTSAVENSSYSDNGIAFLAKASEFCNEDAFTAFAEVGKTRPKLLPVFLKHVLCPENLTLEIRAIPYVNAFMGVHGPRTFSSAENRITVNYPSRSKAEHLAMIDYYSISRCESATRTQTAIFDSLDIQLGITSDEPTPIQSLINDGYMKPAALLYTFSKFKEDPSVIASKLLNLFLETQSTRDICKFLSRCKFPGFFLLNTSQAHRHVFEMCLEYVNALNDLKNL